MAKLLDDLLRGSALRITHNGAELPPEDTLDIVGATVADDPQAKATRVTIPTPLKGDKGNDGDPGPPGSPGAPGAPGVDATNTVYTVLAVQTANISNLQYCDTYLADGVEVFPDGSIILLVGQTVSAQNGPYVCINNEFSMALTRAPWWPAGATMTAGLPTMKVLQGTVFGRTEWEAMPGSDTFVIGTHDPHLLPKSYRITPGVYTSYVDIAPAWFGAISSVDIENLGDGSGVCLWKTFRYPSETPPRLRASLTYVPAVGGGTSGSPTSIGVTIRNWKA